MLGSHSQSASKHSSTASTSFHGGEIFIPRPFLLDIANYHADTLKVFRGGETMMRLRDIELLCEVCVGLEILEVRTSISKFNRTC